MAPADDTPAAPAGTDTVVGELSDLLTAEDDIDLSFAGPEPVAPKAPWHMRALDQASAYLPLVLMAGLAAATWWLVQTAPQADAPTVEAKPRHEPDYVMTSFVVQRFAADGRLRSQIEGDVLRHYPDDDTLEIESPRIRAVGDKGESTLARARHALSNADGSEVQLFGDATIERPAVGKEEAVEFRGEFFHAFRNIEQVRSHLPVVVTQGQSRVRAEGMSYDHLSHIVDLKGRTRAVFESPARR